MSKGEAASVSRVTSHDSISEARKTYITLLPAQALQIWMFRGDKGTCDK